MAINLVTQEMMDLSSIKQEPIRLGHQTFVELFDDPDVSEELKHNIVKVITIIQIFRPIAILNRMAKNNRYNSDTLDNI